MKKRIVSFVLALMMCFSLSMTAFAAETKSYTLIETYATESGVFYSLQAPRHNDTWNIILYIPVEGKMIDFTARTQGGDLIYESTLQKQTSNTPDFVAYIEKGLSSISYAKTTTISLDSTKTNTRVGGAIGNDFNEQLEAIHGSEYSGRLMRRFTSYDLVDSVEIRETLVFRHSRVGSEFFSEGTTMSFIALFLQGKAALNLSVLSLVVSFVDGELENDTTIEYYDVTATTGRWGTVNNGSYAHTMTDKIIWYRGINNLTYPSSAYIVDEGSSPEYTDSASYYNNYSAQADDAYEAFLDTGYVRKLS